MNCNTTHYRANSSSVPGDPTLDAAAVGYRLVLTKADKIKASELAAVHAATEAEARKRPAAFPQLIATSSEKGMGLAEVRAAVLEDALS